MESFRWMFCATNVKSDFAWMTRFIAALTLLAAALLAESPASACTCEFYGSGPLDAMHHAKSVFVGEVLEVREISAFESEDGASSFAVRLRVEKYWKGVKTIEITVHTDLHGCGPDMRVGKKYLVFAMHRPLETACSGTKELAYADADLRALGPGKNYKH
jgi:hypothetical protein